MKCYVSFALIVLVGLVLSSNALPAKKRMIYYHQPARYHAYPQRLMYMQYYQPSRTNARSTQAASALVAGDTVATGTYLEDCNESEAGIAAAGPAVNVANSEEQTPIDGNSATSIAEAYPAEPQTAEVEYEPNVPAVEPLDPATAPAAAQPAKSDDAAKVPREYHYKKPVIKPTIPPGTALFTPIDDQTAVADLPTPAPLAPLKPAASYLPSKKKVYVELEQTPDNTNEVVDEEDENETSVAISQEVTEEEEVEETDLIPVAPPKNPLVARRPTAKKPTKAVKNPCADCVKAAPAQKPKKPATSQQPGGTYFPIDFGGTSGGAIAIANSYSTGEGGSATSHAIAYGSPEAARVARLRPSKTH